MPGTSNLAKNIVLLKKHCEEKGYLGIPQNKTGTSEHYFRPGCVISSSNNSTSEKPDQSLKFVKRIKVIP